MTGRVSRRGFIAGSGAAAGALFLSLSYLRERDRAPRSAPGGEKIPVEPVVYGDFTDLHRERWTWDRVAKGTHTRANCISACAWSVFVKEGVVWHEEQDAVYQAPRPDVPDGNPRGCQKGACYSHLQASASRVLHPLERVGPRGGGRWKRISWDRALEKIADALVDVATEHGTECIVYDHGTTNAGYGPETSGEARFAEVLEASVLDSWSGVGDMPMGCVQTWGMYNCEGTSDDWFRSDCIVVWIGNPSYTRIPDVHFMHEARYRGARLLVVAPDYNATAIHADLWINPRPETDAALALAAAQVIVSEGRHDEAYVREQTDLALLVRDDDGRFLRETDLLGRGRGRGRTDRFYLWDEEADRLAVAPGSVGDGEGGRSIALGSLRPALRGTRRVRLGEGAEVTVRPVFERLREHLEAYTPEKAAAVTGLAPSLIRAFARELATAPAAMIFASWGACKHHHSDLFQRAMILLAALTGNQGKPGGGLRVAAWWGLDGLERMQARKRGLLDTLRVLPKAIRGLTPRDYEQLFTEHSERAPHTPLMPFLYVHGGYRELWSRPDHEDPELPRGRDAYLRESIERGWIRIHPPPGRSPRAYLFTGCNPLRRWPAPQVARSHLWPKLDLVVAVNFRMSTSARYADYVLPGAGYYEKHGIKYAQSYVPYVVLSDRAVEPLGESKSEWEIFGLLAERVARRAAERGVESVRGFADRPLDLRGLYDAWTSGGRYPVDDPESPVRLIDDILRSSPSLEEVGAEEALRRGVVRVTGTGRPTPLYQTYSDYDPEDTHWPHAYFVKDKTAWPTLTGRQQFYIDHPWYLEAGEGLPVHKAPPGARSDLPLRMSGGHTRWSIHAIWRDHELMLRLQRGEPAAFLSPVDCGPRGIADGDRVRVYNEVGAFEAVAKVAPGVRPGEVIVYHAWEPYQFEGWRGQQEPVVSPWKAIHLAGGYGHIHYRMFYGSPGHAPRGAPVEVERVGHARGRPGLGPGERLPSAQS